MSRATFTAPIPLRIEGTRLAIPPFRIDRRSQSYSQPTELRIDLTALEPDVYRVIAVQNFWLEDANPDLSKALAGVFLSRRRTDGAWEEPENWPVECRSLAVLGHIEVYADGHATLLPS